MRTSSPASLAGQQDLCWDFSWLNCFRDLRRHQMKPPQRFTKGHSIPFYPEISQIWAMVPHFFWASGSRSVISGPAASASLGNWFKMHILGPHPRPTSPETLESQPRNLCFHKISGWFWCPQKFENHYSNVRQVFSCHFSQEILQSLSERRFSKLPLNLV